MSLFSLVECVLLGSFAAILGAHRSEILDKTYDQNTPRNLQQYSQDYSDNDGNNMERSSAYEPPSANA